MVSEVVVVPYVVSAVVAVTVMHVLLFVLHVSVLQQCEGAMVTGSVVAVSVYIGGTCGLCVCLVHVTCLK